MLRKTKPNCHHETSAQQYHVKGHTTENASVKHTLGYLAKDLSCRAIDARSRGVAHSNAQRKKKKRTSFLR